MKVNNEKVLKVVERIIDKKIPGDVLHLFRYDLAKCKISRQNFTRIPANLYEFLSSVDTAAEYYPIGSTKPSLYSACIYVDSSAPKKCRINVYSPGKGSRAWTAQVRNFGILTTFKDELIFSQDGENVPFESINKSKDVVAISNKEIGNKRLVIHYVP